MRFKDLEFIKTTNPNGIQALMDYGMYELSVIKSDISYGGKMGLYEIGVFFGGELTELPGITADDDCVAGYLTESEVETIMHKMYLITAKNPVNIQVITAKNMEIQ
jgi:hypothetical protein